MGRRREERVVNEERIRRALINSDESMNTIARGFDYPRAVVEEVNRKFRIRVRGQKNTARKTSRSKKGFF